MRNIGVDETVKDALDDAKKQRKKNRGEDPSFNDLVKEAIENYPELSRILEEKKKERGRDRDRDGPRFMQL